MFCGWGDIPSFSHIVQWRNSNASEGCLGADFQVDVSFLRTKNLGKSLGKTSLENKGQMYYGYLMKK